MQYKRNVSHVKKFNADNDAIDCDKVEKTGMILCCLNFVITCLELSVNPFDLTLIDETSAKCFNVMFQSKNFNIEKIFSVIFFLVSFLTNL